MANPKIISNKENYHYQYDEDYIVFEADTPPPDTSLTYPFEDNKLLPNENMKVSPLFLEKFIIELKSKGYEFISLDRLYEILKNGEKVEKQIVFTLDDGYEDNYKIAYPIFKKYNVPFAVYITTSFPEKKAILWWYILEDLIIENSEIILFDGLKYICKTEE